MDLRAERAALSEDARAARQAAVLDDKNKVLAGEAGLWRERSTAGLDARIREIEEEFETTVIYIYIYIYI